MNYSFRLYYNMSDKNCAVCHIETSYTSDNTRGVNVHIVGVDNANNISNHLGIYAKTNLSFLRRFDDHIDFTCNKGDLSDKVQSLVVQIFPEEFI